MALGRRSLKILYPRQPVILLLENDWIPMIVLKEYDYLPISSTFRISEDTFEAGDQSQEIENSTSGMISPSWECKTNLDPRSQNDL